MSHPTESLLSSRREIRPDADTARKTIPTLAARTGFSAHRAGGTFISNASSEATKHLYKTFWRDYGDWAVAHDMTALPVNSLQFLRGRDLS